MKKIMTFIAITVLVCGFMSTGISQDVGSSLRLEAAGCSNAENLGPLFGTKWEFTVEKDNFSFTDTVTFGTEKDVYLHPCPELFCFIEGYGNGSVHYGELPDGNTGFSAEFTHNSFDFNPRYLFVINDDNVVGAYIGEDGNYYQLTGIRVYPQNEDVRESRSASLTISGSSSVNENSYAYYTATYLSISNVTSSATWSVYPTTYAYFDSSVKGKLITRAVTSYQTVTITASYKFLFYTYTATKTVTISDNICTYSLSPTSKIFTSSGGTGSVSVTASSGCVSCITGGQLGYPSCFPINWTAVSNAAWITITSGSTGIGNRTVSYSVAANLGTSSRNGTITISGGGIYATFTVTQDIGICTYSISPTNKNFTGTGGTGTVSVTASTGCSWTAVSNASWITITSGSSGTGNGTVNYSVASASGISIRYGTITIAGKTFTVGQEICTYALSASNASFNSSGGTGNVSVTATAGCSGWTAVSNSAWITITSGSSGIGNGTVYYKVAANTGTSSRTGTMTIAGKTFTVTQSGVSIPAGTVQGRVIWNEQPVKGATVYATDLYDFNSTKYGSATTDAYGFFSISGIPYGEQYLYVFGNLPEYWVSAVTPFKMESNKGTLAEDTFLCKGFDPIFPKNGDTVYTSRPTLQWNPYPGAVDYAVRVIKVGSVNFIFQRGDNDARIKETSVQVNVDLEPGEYRWRVDSFNSAGHIIGCSYSSSSYFIVKAFCTYSISATSKSFTSSGGTGIVSVTASASNCSWTALSNASWITITSGASGIGSGMVYYKVAANTGTSSRTGTMTIAGKTFTVTQTTKTPTSVSVTGSATVNESSYTNYTATAYFSDGTSQNITTSATWSENSSYAYFDSYTKGKLITQAVTSDQYITVTANYTYNGVTKSGTKSVTVKNIILAAPVQISPLNGSVFSYYPRTTTLKWNSVSGASSYTVEIDCYHCCMSNQWCTDIGKTWSIKPNILYTQYTFDFVGAQPGRWRVWAVDSGGNAGNKSPWWEFRYTQ